ncbi:PREDICTED: raftlin-2 [Miniopterus natalensis]|uniref:raftlin-2 n=1 Tax=Miniopterus natalensis TaxID=291302 RepID=UPI0007A6D5A7|nr:PREDICTED: raftlin-2 [Miniopterus natalensis]
MGCGLRKLEDPDDSSPGKIFSTLKRPQVETKTEIAYEYVLLDFTLQASPNPEVIKINSIPDIVTKVEDYYLKGYIVGAIHPVIQPVWQRKHLPASYLYRVVLSRLKLSPKHSAAPSGQRRPRLVIEECPLTYETQTNDVAKELIEKVLNVYIFHGVLRNIWYFFFVNFLSCFKKSKEIIGAIPPESKTYGSTYIKLYQVKSRNIGQENGMEMPEIFLFFFPRSEYLSSDNKLYIVFNVCDDESGCWTYQEGVLSVKVTRKGSVISTLDADWLELTTFYYKQGLSLIDSFLCWETPKGDHVPKSLEGFFIYEEGSGVLGSSRKGNDAIVVEQWTVIEGCEVKTDYGPLLHTLAECGWLLTSVLATPILRRDSEGNLATKQVVFLQRPVIWNSVAQTPERKAGRPAKGEDRSRLTSSSVGLDTAASQAPETRRPPGEGLAAPSRECWAEGSPAPCSSALRGLDDAQLDQEDGVPQVTCM